LIAPVADNPTMPPFTLTPWPVTGLMVDAFGRAVSAGWIVKKPSSPSGMVRM
jgi:hypothetical protein